MHEMFSSRPTGKNAAETVRVGARGRGLTQCSAGYHNKYARTETNKGLQRMPHGDGNPTTLSSLTGPGPY